MKVAVLCSGFGLGFYIPGLLVAARLTRLGHTCATYVFEDCMTEEKKEHIPEVKAAYHKDFRVAMFANKMDMRIADSIDKEKCKRLLERWEAAQYDYYIVLSGHWVYVLLQYEKQYGRSLAGHVDLLYVDSDYSPSWRNQRKFYPVPDGKYREIWLMNAEKGVFSYYIPIESETAVPYDARGKQLLIHGGGWGMGDYLKALERLSQTDYHLNLVLYGYDDLPFLKDKMTGYMNDPDWAPWKTDEKGRHTFPPFAKAGREPPYSFQTFDRHHGLYSIVGRSLAVITKPGAGSIMDAVASQTPLLYTSPVGAHERKNAALLEKYHMGMPYEVWQREGCSQIALKLLHEQIAYWKQMLTPYPDL